jgi:hypothetical protein
MRDHIHSFSATPEQVTKYIKLRSGPYQAEWEFIKKFMNNHKTEIGMYGYRDFNLAQDGKYFVVWLFCR